MKRSDKNLSCADVMRNRSPDAVNNFKVTRTLSCSGSSVNQYKLGKVAGSGSTSTVYKAKDANDEEVLALKVVKKGLVTKGAVPREMQALERISHPNIVALREVIDESKSNQLVVVMQYLDGTQLNQLKRLPSPEELRKWARQLISALFTCHVLAKVCHRDIKPENLKVTGANNDLMLFDFGASECFTEEDDIVTTTEGTYSYFAPEQLK